MAARSKLLRLLSSHIRRVSSTTLSAGTPQRLLTSTNPIFTRHDFFKRCIQTTPTIPTDVGLENRDATSLNTVATAQGSDIDNGSNLKHSVLSNLKVSGRHDMAMVFTCKVCETRSVKTLCRESYEKGVVVARCGGCDNMHLIADRRGWFGEPGSVEEFLAARGEDVRKGNADTMNLTLEDLAGKDGLEKN
ncbi:hypothetical protein ACFE04_027176 [Oxalis oulophora]